MVTFLAMVDPIKICGPATVRGPLVRFSSPGSI